MLHNFLSTYRLDLIERCNEKAAVRDKNSFVNTGSHISISDNGIPTFIDQIITTLQIEQTGNPVASYRVSGPAIGPVHTSEIGKSAALHGRELSELGCSVDHVVHAYGDLCQAVTDLAIEVHESISVDEYRTFNRCLDNGIAQAVTEFNHQRRLKNDDREQQALNQRLGFLAHEFRNHLNALTQAISAIKSGQVGFGGATGKVMDRSLLRLRTMLDNSMTDVRLTASFQPNFEALFVGDLVAEIVDSAQLEAKWWKCNFSAAVRGTGLAVFADKHLLLSAVGNLLQNAFKFTQPGTKVTLTVYADGDRIQIDVQDQSGGLPEGKIEDLFLPFKQSGRDKSGLGLGLSICQRAVEANRGTVTARDLPGVGSIFSISLPKHATNMQPH